MRSVRVGGVGLAVMVAASACTPTAANEPVALRISPTNVRGQNLVGRIASIQLDVFAEDQGVACNEDGAASGLDVDPPLAPLTRTELGAAGCAAGARFCGQVELERSSVPRIFVARGLDESGALFARACTAATLDRDDVAIELTFQRALAPATCSNAELEPPETCTTAGQNSCDDSCTTQEVLLSTGLPANDTESGQGNEKTAPTLLATPNGIAAIYTDTTSASSAGDVAVRAVTATLGTIATPAALAASFFLAEGTPPGAPSAGAQTGAVACVGEGSLVVAYETAGVGIDVAVRAVDATTYRGAAEQLISGDGTGASGDQRHAAVACSGGSALIAWRDGTSGKVLGRRLTLPATLGRIQELGGASDGTRVTVTRRGTGWLAAWEAGRQIRYRALGEDGTPSGGELALEGDAMRSSPALAALPDGRAALAYTEGDATSAIVVVQRFDAEGRRLGDAVATSDMASSAPFVVALPSAAGGAYAVVWAAAGQVQARYLGGSAGFLLGPVTGTEDAFAVGVRDGRTRQTPTASVTADALVVGWHDAAGDGGIVARLLPLPTR